MFTLSYTLARHITGTSHCLHGDWVLSNTVFGDCNECNYQNGREAFGNRFASETLCCSQKKNLVDYLEKKNPTLDLIHRNIHIPAIIRRPL